MDITASRQIILDTETTGMNKLGVHYEGHRIIEIGAVELFNRRLTGKHFHVYLKPDRLVDPEAYAIHGISDDFLADKPSFAEIADDFLDFIQGAELVIHNAAFDIGFIDYELQKLNRGLSKTEKRCTVIDTLLLARRLFPGKRNSLDALCTRYLIDNRHRTLHGALLDAEILADVYLAMTGGQTSLAFTADNENNPQNTTQQVQPVKRHASNLKVILANQEEITAHQAYLELIAQKSDHCLWQALREPQQNEPESNQPK